MPQHCHLYRYTTDRSQLFERLKHAPLTFPDHVSPVAQV